MIDTYPEFEKTNVVGKATWQFAPDHQLFLEGSYFKADYTYRISPTPVNGALLGVPLRLQPSSAFYPASFITSVGGDPTKPVNVSWRALELGARTSEASTEQYRVVAGLQGVVFKNWDYAAAFNYTENKGEENFTKGYLSTQILAPILNSGKVNFFGLNSAEVVSAMNAAQLTGNTRSDTAKNYGVDGRISNEIYQMPAGPLAFALGGEWRRESLSQTNQPILSSGDIVGGSGTIPSLPEVSRDVTAVFVEFNIPIIKNLEANVAVRYDHYSDFGNTTNPKISLRWQPAKDFLLRGAWGTGFRAPTLSELFQPESSPTPPALRRSAALSHHRRHLRLRSPVQFSGGGGYPSLKPEGRRSVCRHGLGSDAEHLDGHRLLQHRDQGRVDGPRRRQHLRRLPKYSNLVFRGPTPAVSDLAGPDRLCARAAEQRGEADRVRHRPELHGAGEHRLRQPQVRLQRHLHDRLQAVEPRRRHAGQLCRQRGSVGAISRWRHYAQLDWTRGGWGATLAQTFQNGYTEPSDVDDSGERRVGSYSIWDLQGRYTGSRTPRWRSA